MNKMTIIAETLKDNINYSNRGIDANTVGVQLARKWMKDVEAMRMPAYAIAVYNHDHMTDVTTAPAAEVAPLYDALKVVLDSIGEVNGAKLDTENCARGITTIIGLAKLRTKITISNESAHAVNELKKAKKNLEEVETEEEEKSAQEAVDKWTKEVNRLMDEPGNFKDEFEPISKAAFLKAVNKLFIDTVNGQSMKPVEQVLAEVEAKRQARRAATKAKKQAKKAESK